MSDAQAKDAAVLKILQSTQFPLSINGAAVHTDTQGVINPATGEVFAQCSVGGRRELDAAVDAAQEAFTKWSHKTLEYRQQKVRQLAELLIEHQESFITLLTLEQGKGRAGAEWEIGGCIHWLQEIAK